MSDQVSQDRAVWVERVLGISMAADLHPPSTGGVADWQAIRATWQQASDIADKQIAALQKALRESDDEVLEEIAEFGLNGLTGNFKVPLMAGLIEIGGGDPAAVGVAGPKLLGIVRKFREHIDSSEKIEVCDDNPFGVAVSLRKTLGDALGAMEAALLKAA